MAAGACSNDSQWYDTESFPGSRACCGLTSPPNTGQKFRLASNWRQSTHRRIAAPHLGQSQCVSSHTSCLHFGHGTYIGAPPSSSPVCRVWRKNRDSTPLYTPRSYSRAFVTCLNFSMSYLFATAVAPSCHALGRVPSQPLPAGGDSSGKEPAPCSASDTAPGPNVALATPSGGLGTLVPDGAGSLKPRQNCPTWMAEVHHRGAGLAARRRSPCK